MEKFIEWVKRSPFYKELRFMHGERLFIRRDGQFAVLAVELAYQAFLSGGPIEQKQK